MLLSELINFLKRDVTKLLDKEGWSLAFELKEDKEPSIYLKVKDRFFDIAKQLRFTTTEYRIQTFDEIFKEQEDLTQSIQDLEYSVGIQSYLVFQFQTKLNTEINRYFTEYSNPIQLYEIAQKNNYAYINSVHIRNFFSLGNIELKEIKGAKEIYFLGENGDGKSLVLIALHLAFNGREIDLKTDFSFTGKVKEILKNNSTATLSGTDTFGTKYGTSKNISIKNFFAYGAHRGRYSSDRFEQYGFMSLYDHNLELYSPEKLLSQTFLLELEKKLDSGNMVNEEKTLPVWISLKTLINLFEELLEDNVKIDVSSSGVKFTEKGFVLQFSQLSEGYRNLMIWVSDLIYRFQQNHPNISDIKQFTGIVMVDEIELHLHPIWQRKLINQLRSNFPNIQFIFTTHSPTIIQGASEESIIFRIFRDSKTGKTNSTEAFFKKDLDHLMLNTLATSPLFGLDDARISKTTEEVDTSETYLQTRIMQKITEEIQAQKNEGKEFLTNEEIDSLVLKTLKDEINKSK